MKSDEDPRDLMKSDEDPQLWRRAVRLLVTEDVVLSNVSHHREIRSLLIREDLLS